MSPLNRRGKERNILDNYPIMVKVLIQELDKDFLINICFLVYSSYKLLFILIDLSDKCQF
jgi:hypothetical protein